MGSSPLESGDALAAKQARLRAAERREPTEPPPPQELWGFRVGESVETEIGVGRIEKVTLPGSGLTPGIGVRLGVPYQHVVYHVYAPHKIRRVT